MLEDRHILLIKRGQPPAKGKWTLPGGVIEVGESPENALTREVREECGLDIQVEMLVEVLQKVVEDAEGRIRYHYLILDYLASCKTRSKCRQSAPEAGTDVTDARWISLAELRPDELTEGLLPLIDKAMAMNEVKNTDSREREKRREKSYV